MLCVFIVEDDFLNVFVIGFKLENVVVVVMIGLLVVMNCEELEGVIGYEVSYICNYDICILIIVVVLVSVVILILSIGSCMLFYGGGCRCDDDREDGGNILVLIFFILLLIFVLLVVSLV